MKLGITIATFYKRDGSTFDYLSRALTSIKNQTHQDYMVYLIGDDYEKPKELEELSKIIDPKKMQLKNLPVALERSKYSGKALWVCGGCNASNTGIDMSLGDGINYICHLDHDDYWESNHLEEIDGAIKKTKSNFICTLANNEGKIMPKIKSNEKYIKYIPQPTKLIHSSTCINFNYFKIRYRNTIEECGWMSPSDGDMWKRIADFLILKNESGICVNAITTIKDSNMSTMKNI